MISTSCILSHRMIYRNPIKINKGISHQHVITTNTHSYRPLFYSNPKPDSCFNRVMLQTKCAYYTMCLYFVSGQIKKGSNDKIPN